MKNYSDGSLVIYFKLCGVKYFKKSVQKLNFNRIFIDRVVISSYCCVLFFVLILVSI